MKTFSILFVLTILSCQKINSVKVKWANQANQWVDYGQVDLNKKVKITESKNQIIELPQNSFSFKKDPNNHQHHHH